MIYWEKQKRILSLYEAYAKPVREQYELTQMEYDILMFLHNNPEYDTAAEIIRVRQLTKSHVSTSVKKLIEKGYLLACHAKHNNKTIHLQITPLAAPLVADGEMAQKEFGAQLFRGFSEEEFQTVQGFFERLYDNSLEGLDLLRQKKKDE